MNELTSFSIVSKAMLKIQHWIAGQANEEICMQALRKYSIAA